MKQFKAPDLKAPRFRQGVHDILDKDFYNEFRLKYPEYKNIADKEIKEKIKLINGSIWRTVLDERDGVELPNGLGYIFVGSCPQKKGSNPNYALSIQLQQQIQHRNWESDQYTAKIFYTNYENKYRFKNHEQWGFKAVRQFKRTLSQEYPVSWKMFIQVDNLLQISRLFRKQSYKNTKVAETNELLKTYDEFAF